MLRRKLSFPCFFGLLLIAVMNTLSCSGNGGGGNDSSTALVSDAIKDVNTADTISEIEIEVDSSGKQIARTKMLIVFKPTATAQQMDDLLESLNATVTMSLAGTRSVVVRIPDPGSLDAYQAIMDSVESKPYIDFVWQGEISKPLELPDNFADDPPDPAELYYIDHQMAVKGPAAWNLRGAIKSVPKFLIVDWFGKGSPTNNTVNLINNGTFLNLPLGDEHGYHVLGIIAGTFGQHKITGIYPSTIDLSVIDKMRVTDIPTEMKEIIERLRIIPGKVVVNTSIGYQCDGSGGNCIDLSDARNLARIWIEEVRKFGIEDRALFVTAGGNVEDPPGFDIRDAATSYYTSSGGLLGGLTDASGNPIYNLSNTLVVENGLAWDIVDDGLTGPLCLSEWSFEGGNIMGIGEYVWSFVDASGTVGVMSGTSMATPQVAGVAAYLWAVEPNLTPQQIVNILIKTGTEMTPALHLGCSNWATPAPIIDAYAALLSIDAAAVPTPANSPVRLALLDVNADGEFDETDLTAFVLRYFGSMEATEMIQPTDKEYDRYDLSGDGWVGAHYSNTFDLDRSGSQQYGSANISTASAVIHGKNFKFDEENVTDMDIVCYYGYSDLYTGDTQVRDDLLTIERCSEVVVINDTILHLGDNSDEIIPLHGTSYTGSTSVSNANSFEAATLEIKFLGEAYDTGGIDLYPDPPIVIVNGNQHILSEADVPNESGCTENYNFSHIKETCIFTEYNCPFTYRLDITGIINPDGENTIQVKSDAPEYSHCDMAPNYDDFLIGEIRILLH